MHFHRLVLIAALAGPLAACQTITPEERRALDETTCAGYGFRPKTEAMARCLLDLDLNRRADARASLARADRMLWTPPGLVERRVIVRR
jgi:hypothetical protein